MTRVGLIRPNWNCESSIRFGGRSPHLSIEFDVGSSGIETQVVP
jgi:hypothetical protein